MCCRSKHSNFFFYCSKSNLSMPCPEYCESEVWRVTIPLAQSCSPSPPHLLHIPVTLWDLLSSWTSFSLAPTGTCPESVGGFHSAGCPRALLRKAAFSAVAAQRAQLLWHEPGECAHIPRLSSLQSWLYLVLRLLLGAAPAIAVL